jgi:peptide/nickel transport system substrate-binding protein
LAALDFRTPPPADKKVGRATKRRVTANEARARVILLASALLLVLPSCRRQGTEFHSGRLQVDIETPPLSLNPRLASDAISVRICELIFESLVAQDRHGNFVGELAQSIERPSSTELIFHLRRGIRFSDGRPLTARDVKYSYDSLLDPRLGSPKGAILAELESISVLDPYTIAMQTRLPYAPALEMATLGILPYGTPVSDRAAATVLTGSGPFAVSRVVRDEEVLLSRNRFRPPRPLAPSQIAFKVVPDPTVRALELSEGVCDLAENNIQPDLLDYLRRRSNLSIVVSPGTTYQYLAFNFRDAQLRDLRVRRAIAFAIDRESITKFMMRRTARVATGLLSPENWAFDGDVQRYPYQPSRAARLLDEAGYRARPDGMRGLSFVYNTTPEGRRLAEALQAMFKRVGIELKIRTSEWATFYSDLQRGNFDLASMAWVGISDPYHYYMVFDSKMVPPRGLNRGRYANPLMDRLVEAGEPVLDRAQRRSIYGAVQKLAASDLPYVSLWWQDNVAVMSRDWAGFEPFPNGSLRSLSNVVRGPGPGNDH